MTAAWIKNRFKPTFVNITYWLMIYCVLNFTIFPFIPVYFSDQSTREAYRVIIFFLFVITSLFQLLKAITNTNILWKIISFLCALSGLLILFFFYVFASAMAVWTEAGTFYTKKSNPEVRIISRYVDMGAWGGGTSPDDFEIVLHRPLTQIFKLETRIDTLTIDKTEWIKNNK
jgi:hypothetical protein